jgi:hypothetical protein
MKKVEQKKSGVNATSRFSNYCDFDLCIYTLKKKTSVYMCTSTEAQGIEECDLLKFQSVISRRFYGYIWISKRGAFSFLINLKF